MTVPELVIDAELFRKISSDAQYTDLRAMIKSKNNSGEFNSVDIEECLCFEDLLKAILKKKCKIGLSKSLMKEYGKILKEWPEDMKIKFGNIHSNSEISRYIEQGLDYRTRERFTDTLLAHKIHYIAVACSLTHKTIVSTKDDVNSNYNECCDELCRIFVNYKD